MGRPFGSVAKRKPPLHNWAHLGQTPGCSDSPGTVELFWLHKCPDVAVDPWKQHSGSSLAPLVFRTTQHVVIWRGRVGLERGILVS